MDSMRSLNRSLPRTSPQRRAQQSSQQPPEDLLSAFKAAALSVTTLYKSAASLQIPARAAGYQEALEDLLHFLDRENLGLGDGEGWSVRQWATERLDGNATAAHDSEEEEEEHAEEEKVEEVHASDAKAATHEEDMASSIELPSKAEEPPTLPAPQTENTPSTHQQSSNVAFTFRSPHAYPSNNDKESGMDGVTANDAPTTSQHVTRREASPKHVRSRQQRHLNRPSGNSVRNGMGPGAGSKRRFPLGDFFDISGINFDSKDGFDRGSKRNRHV